MGTVSRRTTRLVIPALVIAALIAGGVWGVGRIDGRRVAIGIFDFRFMGGSMGSVVGEKIARCFETALEYAKTRVQFGKPIASFQLVQQKLAIMATELVKGQLLALQLGRLHGIHDIAITPPSIARITP